jgi:uncharacterized membrane protein YuzA (DUF378 family)
LLVRKRLTHSYKAFSKEFRKTNVDWGSYKIGGGSGQSSTRLKIANGGGEIMKVLEVLATVLLLIGGLNWGLIGFFDFNLVAALFGEGSAMSSFIYGLVGLSALFEVLDLAFGFRSMKYRWCTHLTPVEETRRY